MANKKMTFAVFAAFLFCVSCAVGCVPQQKRIKITVGMMRTSSTEESAIFEECKKDFEESYPQYELISSPYIYSADSVAAKYVSGQLPTVFEADASLVKSALNNGYIRNVKADLENFGWLDKADGYFLSQISDGDRVCGVPAEQYSAGMVLNLPCLYGAGIIDKDSDGNYILYENGEAVYPDTFEEIEEACAKISLVYGLEAYGLFLSTGDNGSGQIFADIAYSFGSGNLEYEDGNGGYKVTLSHDEFSNAMRWVKNMSQLKFVDTDEKYGLDDWALKMSRENTGFAFCQSNVLTTALTAYPSLNGNIAFVPMPSASSSVWGGKVYAINGRATDEQVQGALTFLKYMGYGPDTDRQSQASFERRIKELYDKNVSIFPAIPVWNDENYRSTVERIYTKYSNINTHYYKTYIDKFGEIKREGEPLVRDKLYYEINGLFEKMLFEPTLINIVTLLEEKEEEFNSKYL